MRPSHRVLASASALAILAFLAVRAGAAEPDFVVATNGNDAWSGRLAAPTADGKDGPFASLGRAQKAVRELRKAEPNRAAAIVVQVRGGTYRLTEPLVFTPEDSGTAQAPVVYQAAPGETPEVCGGEKLTGWKTDGGRWTVELPDVKAGKWNFAQLFVGGERRYRPRLPKDGYFFINAEMEPSADVQGRGDNRFRFKAGELKSGWANLNDVEILAFQVWTMARFHIAAVDEAEKTVTFTGTTRGRQAYSKLSTGRRYLVENVKEALDTPGEWYLDRKAGVLTYIPKPGEDPSKTEVVAPRIETLVKLNGDVAAGRWVEHLKFQGLSFAHTNWNTPPEGNSFPQAEVNLGAAIEAVGRGIARSTGARSSISAAMRFPGARPASMTRSWVARWPISAAAASRSARRPCARRSCRPVTTRSRTA